MSDSTQGPGWWQASDGKWYPPEQHPDAPAAATEGVPQTPASPPTQAIPPTPPPTAAMPAVAPPIGGPPPVGPPPGGPPPGAPGSRNNGKWIAIGAIAAVIIAIAAFLLLKGDDKKQNVSANSSASSSSSKSSSSSSSRSTSSSSKSSSSSSPDPSALTEQDIKDRLLKAADLGPGFTDQEFTVSNDPTPCGGASLNSQVPPAIDLGSEASSGEAFFEEEFVRYSSESDAQKAVDLFKQAVDCTDATVGQNAPASFSSPQDVTSDIDVPVAEAFEIDFQTEEGQGKVIVVHDGAVVLSFLFEAVNSADTSKLPNEIDIVNKALNRLIS